MLLIFQCVIAVLVITCLVLLKGYSIKKQFGLPFYCFYLGGDIGKRSPVYLEKDCVIGAPDALFFNPLRFGMVVCEFKSRYYKDQITKYEQAQITLYLGMCNKWYLLKPVAVALFGNEIKVKVKYDKALFREIFKLRNKCLNILNN
ncbi:hypothetical protein [uncultured Pseudoalteromonas sp.]|uniref:hypothetical protein n=1 Tax=uncultured Pseudoalteromonas sp. TaxID=114053 RepID=UPI0025999EDC|nr:hypothetical protein [uncultured Pseudoalteromonas sp.]